MDFLRDLSFLFSLIALVISAYNGYRIVKNDKKVNRHEEILRNSKK